MRSTYFIELLVGMFFLSSRSFSFYKTICPALHYIFCGEPHHKKIPLRSGLGKKMYFFIRFNKIIIWLAGLKSSSTILNELLVLLNFEIIFFFDFFKAFFSFQKKQKFQRNNLYCRDGLQSSLQIKRRNSKKQNTNSRAKFFS